MSFPQFTRPAGSSRGSVRYLLPMLVLLSLFSVFALGRRGDRDEKEIVKALSQYFGSTFETSFAVDDEDGIKRRVVLEMKKGRVTTFSIDGEDRPLSDIAPFLEEFQELSDNQKLLKQEQLVLLEEAAKLKVILERMKHRERKLVSAKREQLSEERAQFQKELKAIAEQKKRFAEEEGSRAALRDENEHEMVAMKRRLKELKQEHLVLREEKMARMHEELEEAAMAQKEAHAELRVQMENLREVKEELALQRIELERFKRVLDAIENLLVADGVIEEGDHFEFEMNVDMRVLRVNGAELSEDQYEAYKKLIEEIQNKPLTNRFHIQRD